METAALCKPIQRSADLLRIPGTWVLTGLGKLLAVLGSFPQFRTASTTASHTSFWRFLECQSIEATLTQNGHLTHHEIPSVASLRPGGHFPRIGWPVSPEYAVSEIGRDVDGESCFTYTTFLVQERDDHSHTLHHLWECVNVDNVTFLLCCCSLSEVHGRISHGREKEMA